MTKEEAQEKLQRENARMRETLELFTTEFSCSCARNFEDINDHGDSCPMKVCSMTLKELEEVK